MAEAVSASREERPSTFDQLYWQDGYTWAMQQADALRRRDFDAVDWDNVIEEIEEVGRSERRSWTSHCATLIEHFLKLEYSRSGNPKAGQTWLNAVTRARLRMQDTLQENPGLKSLRPEMLRKAWKNGRQAAAAELAAYEADPTHSATYQQALRAWHRRLPDECPFTLADIEDPSWWPEVAREKLEHRQRQTA